MFSCLLKRVLPFTLTFILGAAIGGLFKANRAEPTAWTWEKSAPLLGHEGSFGYGHSCRMRARSLVAETRPLVILFKPDARWPRELRSGSGRPDSVRALVTFGADGKVQQVEPADRGLLFAVKDEREYGGITLIAAGEVWDAVERAARQIQFEPEMINGVPVSVTKEVEIHFFGQE